MTYLIFIVVAVFPGACQGFEGSDSTYVHTKDECLKLCIRKNATWCSYSFDIRYCRIYTDDQITGGDYNLYGICMKMAK